MCKHTPGLLDPLQRLVFHYTDTHLYVFSLALTLPLIINKQTRNKQQDSCLQDVHFPPQVQLVCESHHRDKPFYIFPLGLSVIIKIK